MGLKPHCENLELTIYATSASFHDSFVHFNIKLCSSVHKATFIFRSFIPSIRYLFRGGDFSVVGTASPRGRKNTWNLSSIQRLEELFSLTQLLQHRRRLFQHRGILGDIFRSFALFRRLTTLLKEGDDDLIILDTIILRQWHNQGCCKHTSWPGMV